MVFSGLFPIDGSDYPALRDALDKLKLNDAALIYEPETSAALGFGFRCGFLGLLHLEIVRERLEREFNLDLISTAPNVIYDVVDEAGNAKRVTNPSEFPEGKVATFASPWWRVRLLPRASTLARLWSCVRLAAVRLAAWITCPRIVWRCVTACPWRRSFSTSSIS